MALLIRIDVDRPYGKHPLPRHLLSRLGSDAWFPRIAAFGYLRELMDLLRILDEYKARAYVFFRRCTLPSKPIMRLLQQGRHEIGLHLEDSRSFATFAKEKLNLEKHVGYTIRAVSKHGSGGARYGWHHYAPYEPDRYMQWARRSSMRLFLGNLENPSLRPSSQDGGLVAYPSAFWLEPNWRDVERFPVEWLLAEGKKSDVVLLVHPENVLESPGLTQDFRRILASVKTKLLPVSSP